MEKFIDLPRQRYKLWHYLVRISYFLLLIASSIYIVLYLADFTIARRSNIVLGTLGIWIFIAYVTVPRIHRWLTKVYLPNYYIGRARTGDGLLGDPVNLAFFGSAKQLQSAMKNSGWVMADELNAGSTFRMIKNTILRRSYPNAPVSSLFLFGNKQDFAFQQEVGGSTSKRHHIRFWKCPKGWYLPGGHKAEWLAAATFDRKVGFSTLTMQITHKIESDIDEERDYVIKSLRARNKINVSVVEHFSSAYHDRNGGGDYIHTDGALPFISFINESNNKN